MFMFDQILPFYHQELNRINKLASEFAKLYPKVASHLNINSKTAEDPDVGRIIEAFAYLTAHIQYKIDDDFPEIAESLLNVLFPHYLRPIPSFSIVQFNPKPDYKTKYFIPKNSEIETSSYSKSCIFTTTYPVELWPLEIESASFSSKPFKTHLPIIPNIKEKVEAIIHLKIKSCSVKNNISDLALKSLRFFIDGPSNEAQKIYELIFNDLLSIGISPNEDTIPIFLDKNNITSVGFGQEEKLLPFSSQAAQGYDLLTEYFIFPEKFLFFDLNGFTSENLKNIGNTFEIYFYFKKTYAELEKYVRENMFRLNCTPIVNIYKQIAEPILFSQTKTEYLVIPNVRKLSEDVEIYSIENVTALNNNNQEITCYPLYGIKYHQQQESYYWHLIRRQSTYSSTDIYLSFTNLDFDPIINTDTVINVETLCTDGEVPHKLPFGAGEPHLQLKLKDAPVTSLLCLLQMTPIIIPKLRNKMRWQLVSHLSMNYFSLVEEGRGLEVLKEMLSLYNFKNSEEHNNMIESIQAVSCNRVTARSPNSIREAICQGIELKIVIDETVFVGNEIFLFVRLLDEVLARYATMNSFIQLTILSINQGILYKCPRRSGKKTLF